MLRVTRAWWSVLAAIAAASLAGEAALYLAAGEAGDAPVRLVRFLSFFTIQSNLLVLGTTLPLVRDPRRDGPVWRVLRLDALLGITITAGVFALLLAPGYEPRGLARWTDLALHRLVPFITLAGWAAFGPRGRLAGPILGRALLWPAAWIAWTFAHGAATGWYPYPFLDATRRGAGAALRNVALIGLAGLALIPVLRWLDRRLPGA